MCPARGGVNESCSPTRATVACSDASVDVPEARKRNETTPQIEISGVVKFANFALPGGSTWLQVNSPEQADGASSESRHPANTWHRREFR